jgi:hypothetical protein
MPAGVLTQFSSHAHMDAKFLRHGEGILVPDIPGGDVPLVIL